LSKEAASRGTELIDLGPSLEYNFLYSILNDLSPKNLGKIAAKQGWFQDLKFRLRFFGH